MNLTNSKKGIIGGKYKILSENDSEKIHLNSLKILEDIGVKVASENILSFFESKGAEVNYEEGIVRIPRDLLTECLSKAPSTVELFGREDRHNLTLENQRVYFGTGGAATQVLDLEGNDVHLATVNTLAQAARLVDALENLHFFIRPVTITDVPEEEIDINTFYTSLNNTTKHVTGTLYTVQGAKDVIEMASMVKGGKPELVNEPIISFILEMLTSPLKLDADIFEIFRVVVKEGIPVIPASAPMTGSTSPITLAGTISQVHAEALFGVAAAQLVNPGAPVIYGAVPFSTNMRNMALLGGSVETAMMNTAVTQMSQYIGIPNYVAAGITDSKIPDQQAGLEKAMSILQVVLAGGNYIHHAGMLESLLTISFEQYVIDNDIIGMALQSLKGITINEDTLAFDVIRDVGHGGHFLAQPHTTRYARSAEHFVPKVADRDIREEWEKLGSLNTRDRARSIAKEILKRHNPKPIPDQINNKIRKRYDIVV